MFKGYKKKVGLKAQTWSVDLVVGIVVFLLLVIVLYALLSKEPTQEKKLRLENEQVLARFDAKNRVDGVPSIIDGENINEAELKKLYHAEEYATIKQNLGITGEFCILLIDDTGGIVGIPPIIDGNPDKLSFGNTADNLQIATNLYCGE